MPCFSEALLLSPIFAIGLEKVKGPMRRRRRRRRRKEERRGEIERTDGRTDEAAKLSEEKRQRR